MLVKEKQILETFSKIIPALPESDKSYLLGRGGRNGEDDRETRDK